METAVILNGSDLDLPVTYAAAPRDSIVLDELAKYKIYEIPDMEEENAEYIEYREFLRRALRPLGFYREHLLPGASSTCYRIACRNQTVAIFRLTPAEPNSVFHSVIPGAAQMKILAVNNVAIAPDARGDLLLGIILTNCALLSYLRGYQVVAGIVRYEVLPLFVDFGTVPVRHDALHVLGDPAICDYITYFLTDDEMHVDYARARGYHYCHRKVTMKGIDADVRHLRSSPAEEAAS